MREELRFIFTELFESVLKEEHIYSTKKYKSKFKMFVEDYISKFTAAEVLTKDEVKECLKDIYKTL